jgi:hypothetical protein
MDQAIKNEIVPQEVYTIMLKSFRSIMCQSALFGIPVNLEQVEKDIAERVEPLRQRIYQESLQVRGNRDPKSSVTWEDLRLLMIRTLRCCADYLEEDN